MEEKLKKLEEELKKYEKGLEHMQKEFSATREGSHYGVEYYDIQIRVYQDMILSIKKEILELKRKRG